MILSRIALVAFCLAAPVVGGCATTGPEEFAAIRSGALGAAKETAIKVSSVRQEYEILSELGLEPQSQALSLDGRKAYDVMTTIDPSTGDTRQIWFDISSFYGRGLF